MKLTQADPPPRQMQIGFLMILFYPIAFNSKLSCYFPDLSIKVTLLKNRGRAPRFFINGLSTLVASMGALPDLYIEKRFFP